MKFWSTISARLKPLWRAVREYGMAVMMAGGLVNGWPYGRLENKVSIRSEEVAPLLPLPFGERVGVRGHGRGTAYSKQAS
jgi:hypothetical protein